MAETLPVVNGSSGTWGGILNTAISNIDNRVDNNTTRLTTLENNSAAGKLIVATSTTRPSPAIGQVVLEIDTGFVYYVASVSGVATRVPFPGSYVAMLRRTSAQSFGSGSLGQVAFTQADYDRLGGWSTTRYTAKVPGDYEFTGSLAFSPNADTVYRQCFFTLNGAHVPGGSVVAANTGNVQVTAMHLRGVTIQMNVNDYVELNGFHNSSATLSTSATTQFQPTMQVKYLGYHA